MPEVSVHIAEMFTFQVVRLDRLHCSTVMEVDLCPLWR